MSSEDDTSGPSKPRTMTRSPRSSSSDSKSQPSSPPTTSKGIGSRSTSGATKIGGLSPGVGLSENASFKAMETSASELDDSTNSSWPHINGHSHDDSNNSDQPTAADTNGDPGKSKKKIKKRRCSMSDDEALLGWTGSIPSMTRMVIEDNSSDEDPSDEALRRALKTGLRIYPREVPREETAAGGSTESTAKEQHERQAQQQQQEQQQQPSLASPPTPMMTSPKKQSMKSQDQQEQKEKSLNTPEQQQEQSSQTKEQQQEQPAKTKEKQLKQPSEDDDRTEPLAMDEDDGKSKTEKLSSSPPSFSGSRKRLLSPTGKQADDKVEEKKNREENKIPEDNDQINSHMLTSPPPWVSLSRARKRALLPVRKPINQAVEENTKKDKEEDVDKTAENANQTVSIRFSQRAKSLGNSLSEPQLPLRTSRSSSHGHLTEDQTKLEKEEIEPKEMIKRKAEKKLRESEENLAPEEKKSKPEEEQTKSKSKEELVTTSSSSSNDKPEPDVVTTAEAMPPQPEPQASTSALKLKATDEFYRLPFAYGWKRELVLPSNGNPKRRTGDVFFIAPNGRKLRSREDIVPLLKGDLTIEHFCFQRLAQEAGPEFELVRRAVPGNVSHRKSLQLHQDKLATQLVTGKRVSKPKVPKGASPPSEGWTSTMAVKGNAREMASASNGSSSSSNANPSGDYSLTPKRSFANRPSARMIHETCFSCQVTVQLPKTQRSSKGKMCQNCLMKGKRKSETGETQPVADQDHQDRDDQTEDDEKSSLGSGLEIGEEIEVSGQNPPAHLFNNVGHNGSKEQEVVVIGGRKAIAIKADPPRQQVKVVPRQPEKKHPKRMDEKKKSSDEVVLSLGDAHNGCQVLTAIMKTMNLKERANMSKVCKTWAMVSREMSVWRSVCLRDTHINNWVFLLRDLARRRTRELDMMGVIMATPQLRLTGDLRVLKSLRVLRTDTTDAEFLHLVFRYLNQLLELRTTCMSGSLSLSHLERSEELRELRVLRIRMTEPKATISSLNTLGKLKKLTELSLCGVSNLGKMNVLLLKELTNLESLSLGFCQGVNCRLLGTRVLPALKALRSLRLENDHRGMTALPVNEIMRGVSLAGGVSRLELVNFDVDEGFSAMLADCPSVSELLLTPKCMQNTANMTNSVIQAVNDNARQLQVFRLGLVAQLLSATGALYKGPGKDVIPVTRPVPGVPANDPLNACQPEDNCSETDHSQCMAFVPKERLELILHNMMPHAWLSVAIVSMCATTKVKFLRRPEAAKKEN
ncbi:uncharacterized protein LOC108095567 isoform X2 [Drosophila ficusphila]|uniref:uncharacterized protein LOC108095567 isoform X2 n=1 Tax=Drosophila ficusphila TaxID=30025 RepID=UPI0007E7AB79|nr:uncharacterized protein LOC108095567 isoform X2 [Drosophila ficusphila]